ncbi:DNA glycosylase [Pleurotus eryngii]|uniref:DNA glycosylase n=1 Tax=Pleurotus eryngii TaxID=5323 RepID=A0A9P5ZX30_PLEER|nr:DNA glycosylase [Pleurotus eryngii]
MEPEANGDKASKTLLALKTKYEYLPTSSTGTKSSGSTARPSPYACSPRRSSRIIKKEEGSVTVQESAEEELVVQEMAVASRSKSSPSPKKKRRQGKRGYAPPETYAHLSNLTDCLKFELDVVFCGINPGRLSAQVGHHFANPNNHFWKALAASGFTSKRVPPHEDVTLPDLFNIGLTDLVERPTSGESELSAAEKAASVLSLLSKIAHFRPRIVAFVGLGIAKVVELGALKLNNSMPSNKGFKLAPGLQSFKLVYADTQEITVGETLFYAMPSSSGAVSQYQLADKVKIMEDVRNVLGKVKARILDTSSKNSITPEQLPDFSPAL